MSMEKDVRDPAQLLDVPDHELEKIVKNADHLDAQEKQDDYHLGKTKKNIRKFAYWFFSVLAGMGFLLLFVGFAFLLGTYLWGILQDAKKVEETVIVLLNTGLVAGTTLFIEWLIRHRK